MKGISGHFLSPDELWVYFSKPARRGFLISLTILLFLLLPLWRVASLWYEDALIKQRRAEDTIHLTVHGNALTTAINERFALLEGLYAFALAKRSTDALKRQFDVFASGLYSGAVGIRNFSLAPGGVQRYVYPLHGNENVPGHDLINDPRPQVRVDVRRAMETRKIALSGAYELRQGGMGLIARKALYLNGAFWGLATMVIDLPPILKEAELTTPQVGIEMALQDSSGKIIFGNISVFENDPVRLRVELPEGFWVLGAIPVGGWKAAASGRLRLFQGVGLFIVGLLFSLLCLVVNRQRSLMQAIAERTLELGKRAADQAKINLALRESEEKYRLVVNNAAEAILIAQEGMIRFTNPGGEKLLGYSEGVLTSRSFPEFIHPDDREMVLEHHRMRFTGEAIPVVYPSRIVAGDETIKWVEIHTAVIPWKGMPATLNFLNDITQRKQAEEALDRSFANSRKALSGTVQAIAMVVEMKDPYTAGHQRRVAQLSLAIAVEMRLNRDLIEGLRMAATIHDIGKVSVPAEILSKPTKLTPNELSLIKIHPQTGYDILKEIEFPWPVAQMVFQHHERLDGSGYPTGLKRDDISLEARIIAVADVVEAMAAHRPYRSAFGIESALNEIEKNRGTLYDNAVADACLILFREKGFQLQVT